MAVLAGAVAKSAAAKMATAKAAAAAGIMSRASKGSGSGGSSAMGNSAYQDFMAPPGVNASAGSRVMAMMNNSRDTMRMDRNARRQMMGLPSIRHTTSSLRDRPPFG